jgi:hypothetical protein
VTSPSSYLSSGYEDASAAISLLDQQLFLLPTKPSLFLLTIFICLQQSSVNTIASQWPVLSDDIQATAKSLQNIIYD